MSAPILRLTSVAYSVEALRSLLFGKGIRHALARCIGVAVSETLRAILSPSPPYALPLTDTKRTIFITGAASGIGLAAAKLFASRGWFVGLYDVSKVVLEDVAAQFESSCCFGVCDVTNQASVAEAFENFKEAAGGQLHCLFNCAGLLRVGMMEELDMSEQLAQIRVNLDGVIVCTREALPLLRSTQGSVVINMASSSGLHGVPTHAVYSATKSAVFALTEAFSLEFEKHRIRVCDLFVAYVNTPLLTASDVHVPKESRLLVKIEDWVSASDVAEVVWKAANARGSLLHRVHFPVNTRAWVTAKASKLDALLGLGLTPAALRRDVLAKVIASKL